MCCWGRFPTSAIDDKQVGIARQFEDAIADHRVAGIADHAVADLTR
jgi:hypothetical protein